MSVAAAPRARTAAVALFALAGLATVGRLALEAWLLRPEPGALPAAPDASPAAAGTPPPAFLLVIVDGLREEAVRDEKDPAMPAWIALSREGVGGTAITGEPTLTACCVRTILTGRTPDLYTAFANFTAKPVEGSLVQFCVERGARAAHAGDAAAWQMAGRYYRPEDVLAFPDQGASDQGGTDDRAFPFALAKALAGECSVMTVHLVRPDHVGHRFGAAGPEYRGACAIVDRQIRELVAAFRGNRPDATVLLAADHGVTSRGTHGGGEAAARRAPFVLLGPRIARVGRLDLPQSSLAPTVAAVLDLPPPPLAETPPAFGLTTLSPEERTRFLDAYVRARLEVAARTGAGDIAALVEAKRARIQRDRGGAAALAELGAVSAELEATLSARDRPLAAGLALALAGAFLAVLALAVGPARAGTRQAVPVALGVVAVAASLQAPLPLAVGALALAGAVLLRSGLRHDATPVPFALALFALVAVFCGAGLALQSAYDAVEDAGPVALRTAAAGAALVLAAALYLSRRGPRESIRRFAAARPGALVVAAGLALGFALSLRMFIDPYVHTTLLFAAAALGAAAAVAFSPAARARAPRAGLVAFAAVAALVALGRVVEHLWGADGALAEGARGLLWLAPAALVAVGLLAFGARAARERGDRVVLLVAALALASSAVFRVAPGLRNAVWSATLTLGLAALGGASFAPTPSARLSARLLAVLALAVPLHDRSDAQVLGIALLVLSCRAAAELPAPRTRAGVAGLAVAVLAVRIGAFHALGFTESFSAVDVGAGFAPGAAQSDAAAGGGGVTAATLLAVALLSLKFALVWIAPLSAAAHALRRDRAPFGFATLCGDLVVAVAARGPAIVAALWVWSRSSWWVKSGYTVFLFGAADVALVLAAFGLLAREARGERAPAAPALAPLAQPASV